MYRGITSGAPYSAVSLARPFDRVAMLSSQNSREKLGEVVNNMSTIQIRQKIEA